VVANLRFIVANSMLLPFSVSTFSLANCMGTLQSFQYTRTVPTTVRTYWYRTKSFSFRQSTGTYIPVRTTTGRLLLCTVPVPVRTIDDHTSWKGKSMFGQMLAARRSQQTKQALYFSVTKFSNQSNHQTLTTPPRPSLRQLELHLKETTPGDKKLHIIYSLYFPTVMDFAINLCSPRCSRCNLLRNSPRGT